jgi:hypothetical protein
MRAALIGLARKRKRAVSAPYVLRTIRAVSEEDLARRIGVERAHPPTALQVFREQHLTCAAELAESGEDQPESLCRAATTRRQSRRRRDKEPTGMALCGDALARDLDRISRARCG